MREYAIMHPMFLKKISLACACALLFALPTKGLCDFQTELLKDLEKIQKSAKKIVSENPQKKTAGYKKSKRRITKISYRGYLRNKWWVTSSHSSHGVNIVLRGDTTEKKIALTFDDGPFPYYTQMILDILKKYNVKATFFMVGEMVKAYPHVAKRIVDEGHDVGNHSYTHPKLTYLSKSRAFFEIAQTDAIIKKITGQTPKFFRPPYGSYQKTAYLLAEEQGHKIILWSADCRDWSKPGVQSIVARVTWGIKPGAIILLHDGGGNRMQTVKATEILIQQLLKSNYKIVTLSEMLNMNAVDTATAPPSQPQTGAAALITAPSASMMAQPQTSPQP